MARKGDRAEVVIAAIDKVAAPIRKINRQLESMTAPARRVQRNLRAISKELNFAKLGRGLKSLGRGLRNVGVAAVAGVGVSLLAVKKLAESGDDIAKLTKRLGFNAQAFQELEHAAAIQGVTTEEYRKAVATLTKRMGELKAGTGDMLTILSKVAPSFRDQLVATEKSEDAFVSILGFIHKLEDPMKKAAIANMAFGRSGASLVNMADAGADGIENLRMEARALGIVMSDSELSDSEDMVDTFTRLTGAVTGVARQIGFALFPTVEGIALKMKDWVVLNREWLGTGLADGVAKLTTKAKAFGLWLEDAGPKTLEFVDQLGGFKTVAIALGVVLLASLLAPLVLVAATIGLIPSLFVAGGAAVLVFQDQIAAFFSGGFGAIGDLITGFGELVGVENTLAAAHAQTMAFNAPGGAENHGRSLREPLPPTGPVLGPALPPPELTGAVRVEVAGTESADVTADFGGVSSQLEQGSNMPVE